jgi:hypothetical protein
MESLVLASASIDEHNRFIAKFFKISLSKKKITRYTVAKKKITRTMYGKPRNTGLQSSLKSYNLTILVSHAHASN